MTQKKYVILFLLHVHYITPISQARQPRAGILQLILYQQARQTLLFHRVLQKFFLCIICLSLGTGACIERFRCFVLSNISVVFNRLTFCAL